MGDTFVQPDASGQTGSAYKSAIDASIAVLARIGQAFAPHEQSTPDMTVRVDAGYVLTSTGITEVAGQDTGAITAPSGDPRIDRVVIDLITGAVSVVTGAEDASPVAPDVPAGKAPCCQVALVVSQSSIVNNNVTDERAIIQYGVGNQNLTLNALAVSSSLSGAGNTDILTHMITAGLLAANGDTIRVEAAGTLNAGGGTVREKVYFDGVDLTGPTVSVSGGGLVRWTQYVIITRRSATTIEYSGIVTVSDGTVWAGGNALGVVTVADLDSNNVILKSTGEITTAGLLDTMNILYTLHRF